MSQIFRTAIDAEQTGQPEQIQETQRRNRCGIGGVGPPPPDNTVMLTDAGIDVPLASVAVYVNESGPT